MNESDGFRKSTFSDRKHCVEVAIGHEMVRVRDSKAPGANVLEFTLDEWRAFISGATAGEFDC